MLYILTWRLHRGKRRIMYKKGTIYTLVSGSHKRSNRNTGTIVKKEFIHSDLLELAFLPLSDRDVAIHRQRGQTVRLAVRPVDGQFIHVACGSQSEEDARIAARHIRTVRMTEPDQAATPDLDSGNRSIPVAI